MPETNIEYRLGQLDTGVKALVNEVRGLREDLMARIEQHDRRDDERFNSHGTRLGSIEQKLAVDKALEEHEHKESAAEQSWKQALMGATAPIAAAAVTALITWLSMRGHL